MLRRFLRIRLWITELKLHLGARLIASADYRLANDFALWDDVQDTIENQVQTENALRCVGKRFTVLAQRMNERAEDVRLERLAEMGKGGKVVRVTLRNGHWVKAA